MDIRKTVLLLYAICILLLFAGIAYAFTAHEIIGVAAILVTVFFGSFQARGLMLMLTKSVLHHYEESGEVLTMYEYRGTENPASNGVVAGIIMFIAIAVSIPVTDWAYLNLTPINPLNIMWTINGVLSFIAGLLSYRIVKWKEPVKTRVRFDELYGSDQ